VPELLTLYLLAMNLVAFTAFAGDKRRAERGEWRVPERTLLTLAAAGGWAGANVACELYRHKTRKEPFASHMRLIGVMQVIALALVWVLRR
jgi:uncharacterized membrane protein YsdA (DUF1294 family)